MKAFTALLLSMLLLVGIAGVAAAQTAAPTPGAPGSTTGNPESKPDNPTDRRSDPAPASPSVRTDRAPDVNVDVRTQRDGDSPSALPRTSTETTRIFGLSPTMAILIAAALFVVVILALVSMTRNGGSRTDTHLDLDRRP